LLLLFEYCHIFVLDEFGDFCYTGPRYNKTVGDDKVLISAAISHSIKTNILDKKLSAPSEMRKNDYEDTSSSDISKDSNIKRKDTLDSFELLDFADYVAPKPPDPHISTDFCECVSSSSLLIPGTNSPPNSPLSRKSSVSSSSSNALVTSTPPFSPTSTCAKSPNLQPSTSTNLSSMYNVASLPASPSNPSISSLKELESFPSSLSFESLPFPKNPIFEKICEKDLNDHTVKSDKLNKSLHPSNKSNKLLSKSTERNADQISVNHSDKSFGNEQGETLNSLPKKIASSPSTKTVSITTSVIPFPSPKPITESSVSSEKVSRIRPKSTSEFRGMNINNPCFQDKSSPDKKPSTPSNNKSAERLKLTNSLKFLSTPPNLQNPQSHLQSTPVCTIPAISSKSENKHPPLPPPPLINSSKK
jgi:hypothetical protein